jgi:hypothetical protein
METGGRKSQLLEQNQISWLFEADTRPKVLRCGISHMAQRTPIPQIAAPEYLRSPPAFLFGDYHHVIAKYEKKGNQQVRPPAL